MAVCNRRDKDLVWNVSPGGEHWSSAKGGTFPVWCSESHNVNLDYQCRTPTDGVLINAKDRLKASYKDAMKAKGLSDPYNPYDDANFQANWWGPNIVTGWACGTGSLGRCTMVTPLEKNKYACCTNGKTGILQCGDMWCRDDTANCLTFMKNFCSPGTNLIDDDNCYSMFKISKADVISEFCSDPKNIQKNNCKAFCDQQITSSGGYKAACLNTAAAYCEIPANKTKKECDCINFSKSAAFTAMVAKYPQLGQVGVNTQCWTSNCAGPDAWSKVMTSYTGVCPTTVQICAQTLNVSSVSAQNIGQIGSQCSLSSNTGSTFVTTPASRTPPASTPPASRTPPASTPPASTPPASTPPASTPPASTPPASTPTPSTTTITTTSSSSSGLGPGAIAGIVIGGVFLLIFLIAMIGKGKS